MRKLAAVTLSFSAAVLAANYILPINRLLDIAAVLGLIGAVLLLLLKKKYKLIAAALLFFSIGLCRFYFHNENTTVQVEKYVGNTLDVTAEVLDFPEVYDDYCRLEVRVKSNSLPELKAYLYDNEKDFAGARPGDIVFVRAKIKAADTLYGEKYDNYHSKGIYFKLSSVGDAKLSRNFDIRFLPQYLSRFLSARIGELFPEDTEVFMRSLMLGDKSDFYDDEKLYVSLSRAGLMHIVAVSGMHISFLVGLLQSLFGRSRRGAYICIIILWLFALLTGAGVSVVRAAFMHTYFLMAPIMRRENDSLTSLSLILAVLLFVNPFSIAGISLQLSFGAMCGIVLFTDRIYKQFLEKFSFAADRPLLKAVLASVSCSLSVMIFTVPLTALHFGNVQLLSPISNLLCLWAVSVCFCWAWISCALSAVPFLGIVSAALCSYVARFILLVAEIISEIPFSVLYMETEIEWIWLLITYLLFLLVYICKAAKFYVCLALTVLSMTAAGLVIFGRTIFYKNIDTFNVLDVGQGQCVTVLEENSSIMIDCGNINTIDDAGTIAAAHLYSRGRSSLDYLILSHMHEDHADGAAMLMEMIEVETLVLPGNCDKNDVLYRDIMESAKRNGTNLIELDEDIWLQAGDINVKLVRCGFGDDENERCIIAKVELNGVTLLAMADSSWRMEKSLCEEHRLRDVDVLIVSHHGSKYSSTEELLEEIGGGEAVISVGTNYYGHPHEETLEALETYGYNIKRTDELGNIEIRIGNSYVKKIWETRRKIELLRRGT